MNWAEEKALEFYDKNPDSRPPPPKTYYNSKKLVSFEQLKRNTIPEKLQHKIKLSEDSHFSNQVNISFSSVHVPTSIYERSEFNFDCAFNCVRLNYNLTFLLSRRRRDWSNRLVIKHGPNIRVKLQHEPDFELSVFLQCHWVPEALSWSVTFKLSLFI